MYLFLLRKGNHIRSGPGPGKRWKPPNSIPGKKRKSQGATVGRSKKDRTTEGNATISPTASEFGQGPEVAVAAASISSNGDKSPETSKEKPEMSRLLYSMNRQDPRFW